MKNAAKAQRDRRISPAARAHAERVGTAELRSNLAKYLRQAEAGEPVIIQDRGRDAYVLLKLEDSAPPSIFGCMGERTEYARGAVVNSAEEWSPGIMP